MLERFRKIFKGARSARLENRAPIRILLVDDSAFIRLVLTRRLNQHPLLRVVGDAASGMEAVSKIDELAPDVIVLDMEMPRGTGLDLLKSLPSEHRRRCLLFSSLHPDDASLRASVEIGAGGVVRKSTRELDLETLVQNLVAEILRVGANVQGTFRRS
jgi:two-component system, chemotaxis family, protein-glutamate methylesterase/glutaminase